TQRIRASPLPARGERESLLSRPGSHIMAKPLADRVALVTGASRGIGAATALALGRAGAHVVAVARTVGGLEEIDDAIRTGGGSAPWTRCCGSRLPGVRSSSPPGLHGSRAPIGAPTRFPRLRSKCSPAPMRRRPNRLPSG